MFDPLARWVEKTLGRAGWRPISAVLLVLSFGACEGPVGPTGPAGQQGLQGPPGLPGAPATIRWGTDTIDSDGEAGVRFTGAQVKGSVVNCYFSPSSSGPWQALAGASGAVGKPWCGALDSGADLLVVIFAGPPGWVFLATVAEGG